MNLVIKDLLLSFLTGVAVFLALSLLFAERDLELKETNKTFYGEF